MILQLDNVKIPINIASKHLLILNDNVSEQLWINNAYITEEQLFILNTNINTIYLLNNQDKVLYNFSDPSKIINIFEVGENKYNIIIKLH